MPRIRGDLGIVHFKERFIVPGAYGEELFVLYIRGVDPHGDRVWYVPLETEVARGHVTFRGPIEGPILPRRIIGGVMVDHRNG